MRSPWSTKLGAIFGLRLPRNLLLMCIVCVLVVIALLGSSPSSAVDSVTSTAKANLFLDYRRLKEQAANEYLELRLILLEENQISFHSEDGSIYDDVKDYSHQIAEMIGLRSDSEFFQAGVRTVLDVGCGFGSFGAHLLSLKLMPLCVAAYEVTGSQVQLALERGLPAMIGNFISKQLPYPSLSFGMVHCTKCGISWDKKIHGLRAGQEVAKRGIGFIEVLVVLLRKEVTYPLDVLRLRLAVEPGCKTMSEVVSYADRFHNKAILLIHFSARYEAEISAVAEKVLQWTRKRSHLKAMQKKTHSFAESI